MPAEPETTGNVTPGKRRVRTIVLVLEIGMILTILGVWLGSETVRASRSLLVLFFYSFPSEFLVGLVPHEPILLWYGEFFPPWIVALVSVAGTVPAEMINYSVFSFFTDTKQYRRLRETKTADAVVRLFGKAPFAAILVAGFTPLPFFPVRFLVVMGNYPIMKYALGVFLSRAPRFYILAAAGNYFRIPGAVLAGLFAVLIILAWSPVLKRVLKRREMGGKA